MSAKPSVRSRHRLLWLLLFVGLLLLLLLTGFLFLKRGPVGSAPRFTRGLSPDTRSATLNWVHSFNASNLSEPALANTLVIVYVAQGLKASLVALEASTGRAQWANDLPLERSGIRTLVSDNQAIFAGTALGIDAYQARTGEQLWSTRLGQGHVSIIEQLDGPTLRVYYGQDIYELDPSTGQIVAKEPKPAPTWIANGIAIYRLSNKHMEGIDVHTGRMVWDENAEAFFVDDVMPPVAYQDHMLLVGTDTRGICAMDIRTGTYNWCRQESYISKITFDPQTDLGYILRKDFVLVQLDLRTGDVLTKAQFLPSQLPEAMQNYVYQYFALLKANQVLLLFGDSQELFSLTPK